MGRRSLAALRREQLLDAVQTCIVRYGLAGTTLARIGAEADMAPSIIRHYLGNRDEVIRAAVDKALANVRALTEYAGADASPRDRLNRQIDVLFDPALAIPGINQLIDELIAASYVDQSTRDELRNLYEHFTTMLATAIDAAYPTAPPAMRQAVAHGLLALAHADATFHWLDFDPDHYRKARQATQLMIDALASG
jgi:AcrR family transcriptional regulator